MLDDADLAKSALADTSEEDEVEEVDLAVKVDGLGGDEHWGGREKKKIPVLDSRLHPG